MRGSSYRHAAGRALRQLQLGWDAASLMLAMVAARFVQQVMQRSGVELKEQAPWAEYALLAYAALPLWLCLVVVLRLDRTREHPLTQTELVTQLAKLHLAGLTGLAVLHFATQAIVNRSLVLLFLASSFVLMYAQRSITYAWLKSQFIKGHARPSLLVVGQHSRRMSDFLKSAESDRVPPVVIGRLCEAETMSGLSLPPADGPTLTHLGGLTALQGCLESHAVSEVVFFAPYQRPESVPAQLAICEVLGVPASFVVDVKQLSRAAPKITELYNHCVISFDVAPKRPEALAIKHGLDPLLALLVSLLASPLLLAIAFAIRVSMGGPILFTQERAGRYGRAFRMFKFRTMHNDAEARRAELLSINEHGGPVFKSKNDPRITRLGHLLRRTSLDELPQLFNVISGSMSMVGPRPLPTVEHEQIHGWQRRRLSMKPGITGLWQVSGRSDVDFEQWMLLDLKYVDDWSLWLDLQILLKTVPVVVLGRGAR